MFKNILGKVDQPGLQNFILNLIYPAVLGAIIYSTLDFSFDLSTEKNTEHQKLAILIPTIIFYITDYYYTKYTNIYRGLFFSFDLFFIAGLYLSIKFLDLKGEGLGNVNIEPLFLIAIFYLIFMVLYLVWDSIEFFGLKTEENLREKTLYLLVIFWEILTIILLAYYLCSFAECKHPFCWLVLILTLTTILFMVLTFCKQQFSKKIDHHNKSEFLNGRLDALQHLFF